MTSYEEVEAVVRHILGLEADSPRAEKPVEDVYAAPFEARANLQAIGAFLRGGTEPVSLKRDTFAHREEEAWARFSDALNERFGREAAEEIGALADGYVLTMCDIDFSIGMKCGARLLLALLSDFSRDN